MLLQQPQSLTEWLTDLGRADIPVLKRTARELERLRADEAQIDVRSVANVVTDDPLMTVKLLRHMQSCNRTRTTTRNMNWST